MKSMTDESSPARGTLGASLREGPPKVLLAGDVPADLVAALPYDAIQLSGGDSPEGLLESGVPIVALSRDPAAVAALYRVGVRVILGVASLDREVDLARSLLAAGASDILEPGIDAHHLRDRLRVALLRQAAPLAGPARDNREAIRISTIAELAGVLATGAENAIPEVLMRIGEGLQIGHASVVHEHTDPMTGDPLVTRRWSWSSDRAEPLVDLQAAPARSIPPYVETILCEMRMGTGPLLGTFDGRATLAYPLVIQGTYWGALIFEAENAGREWAPQELALTRTAHAGITGGITRRGQEEIRRDREERFREVFENTDDMVFTNDLKLMFTSANPAVEHVLGYRPDEIIGQPLSFILSDQSISRAHEMSRKKMSGEGESTRYELSMRRRDGSEVPVEVVTRLVKRDGVVTGTQGIARDLSRRFETQRQLRERAEEASRSEAAFRTLFDKSPQPMLVHEDVSVRIIEVNEAACRTYGWTREEFLQRTMFDLRPQGETDRSRTFFFDPMRPEVEDLGVWKHRVRDGTLIDVHIHTRRLDFGGHVARVAIIEDVTTSVRVDAALRRALKMNDNIMASASDVIVSTDTKGVIEFVNQRALEALGYEPQELIGKHFTFLAPAGQEDAIDDHLTGLVETLPIAYTELPVRLKDGTTRWFAWGIAPLLEDGEHLGSVACGHDITPQREAEAEIQWLASLVASSPNAILTATPAGKILSWNAAAERLFGYSTGEVVNLDLRTVIRPGDSRTDREIVDMIYTGKTIENIDLRTFRKDGTPVDISTTAFPIQGPEGDFSLIGLIAVDITDKREAAREVAQLGAVVQASTEAIVMTSPSGLLTHWNAAAERIFGYTKEEVLGRSLNFLLPAGEEDRGREIGRRLLSGTPIEGFEIRGRRKDGRILLVDFTAFPVFGERGQLTSLAGIMRDITVQRANEDVDRERQEVLSLAYRSLHIGIFVASEDGIIQSANDEACHQFGRTREELIGIPHWTVLPEQVRDRVEELHRHRMSMEAGSPGTSREWLLTLPSGEKRMMTSVTGRFDRSDGARFLVLAGTDITAEKNAEEQLARLAAIVESSGDAMMSADLDGLITTWNRGAEQLFGWAEEEVVGKPLTAFYSTGTSDDGKITIDLLKQGGRIDGVETRAVRRDGEVIDVSVSLFGVRDASGRLVSVAGVGRDVSEQKRTREELQRRVADLQSLYRLRVRLAEVENESDILNAGLDAMTEVLGGEMGSARLATDLGTLRFVVVRGLSADYTRWVQAETLPMMVAHGSKPVVVPSVEEWAGYGVLREAMLAEGIASCLGVPLMGLDQPFGSLSVYYREGREFSPEEVEIAQTIAGSIAIAMEQRAARSALQRSIERFEAVAAATKDAIWDLEVATRRIWWSGGFEVMFGYHPGEIEETFEYWERLIHPDDRQAVIQGFHEAIGRADDFWSDEYRFLRADGTYADIFDRGYIVKDEHGVASRVIGSMIDVTALRNAEKETREQERFLSAIIDHSPLGIQVFNADGISIRMNEARRDFLGIADTNVGIGAFNPLTDPFMLEMGFAEAYERAYHGETILRRDQLMDPTKDKIWGLRIPNRWFDQWVFPVKDDNGNVTAVVSMVNDVSERHQSQEDLRTAQQYLQSVISNAPLLMFVWDRDGNFMMAAGAAVSGLIGEASESGLAANVYHLFADQPGITNAVRRGLEGEETSFEMEYNDCIWDAQYTPMRDDRGEITGVIGVSTDISDRKRAEVARGLAEQRLLALAESLPIIFFALDADGLLTLATGKGLRSLTDDPASLIGRPLFDMTESFEFDQSVARALRGQSFTDISPIGEQWFETHFEPVVGGDGTVRGTLGVSLDITERRKTEEALLQSQKLESLGILAGGIAHDFNNLLVGIMGNAGLALMELPPDSPARETIEEIEMAGQRAAELARQMLAYSGKGRFVVQRIDLSSLVEEMTQLLRVSITKSALLDYHFERGLPTVEVDTTQLRQVVMNLVINASDAIGDDDGKITITTGLMHADRDYLSETYLPQDIQEGEYVYLEIEDTGKGMDAETRGRVFDPFFTTKFTGRGLGLAAVLGIVRGHKGAIKVTSEPGRGTTFRLLLPAAGPAPETPEGASTNARPPRVWRANGTILIADDESTVRNVTARALETFGFKTVRAVDGQDAVELFQKHRAEITCVLMDLTMPRMNGEEALNAILGIDPYVRIVLMSGFAEQEAMARFAGKGLAGFIQKPYEFERLRETLRIVLESAPPSAAGYRRASGN